MNKFNDTEIETLREFGFTVEPNHARRVRELVTESISKTEVGFNTGVSAKNFHSEKASVSLADAMSNIDLLRYQIRKELKELLQQL